MQIAVPYHTPEEQRVIKSRAMRSRRSCLSLLSGHRLNEDLNEMSDNLYELTELFYDDEDSIMQALGDNDEEFTELKFMADGLQYDLEQFIERFADVRTKTDGEDVYVLSELLGVADREFDDAAVLMGADAYGVIGYDSYDHDWYDLDDWQTERAKEACRERLMKHSKAKILDIFEVTVRVFLQFVDIRNKYDGIKGIVDLLTGDEHLIVEAMNKINELYEACQGQFDMNDKYSRENREFANAVASLPERMWVE